jgi:hypothetical protein
LLYNCQSHPLSFFLFFFFFKKKRKKEFQIKYTKSDKFIYSLIILFNSTFFFFFSFSFYILKTKENENKTKMMVRGISSIHYVRVKRQKTTVFLYVEKTQTISTLKENVSRILHFKTEDMKLTIAGPDAATSTRVVLEDSQTVGDYILDDAGRIVYLTLQNADGSWEEEDIHDPEPIGATPEQIEAIRAQHQNLT